MARSPRKPAVQFDGTQFGEILRRNRRDHAMSLEKWGEDIGVSWQQAQKYEKDVNRIGVERLFVLFAVHNVSIDLIFQEMLGVIPARKESTFDVLIRLERDLKEAIGVIRVPAGRVRRSKAIREAAE